MSRNLRNARPNTIRARAEIIGEGECAQSTKIAATSSSRFNGARRHDNAAIVALRDLLASYETGNEIFLHTIACFQCTLLYPDKSSL